MTKLKTLKEIDSFHGYPNGDSVGIYSKGDLQDIACEWIKELDNACEDLESDNDWIELMIKETSHRGNWGRDVVKRWIKHFFNLEDEND
jgi:hypothetical protein